MSYDRITWLPKVLRDAGIEVVLYDGWESRGLSTSRPFEPKHVVWHHDASAPGDSPGVPHYMIRNMQSAGAQVWIDRKGRWHIVASGRMAHAGDTLPGKPDNYNSIGIETDHTTGEAWPDALLDSLRRGTKAIFDHWKVGVDHLHFHKSICDPPGRKVDPDGLDLGAERKRVKAIDLSPAPRRKPKPSKPEVSVKAAVRASKVAGWARRIGNTTVRQDARLVKRALKAEGVKNYAEWQEKCNVSPANGRPDEKSLKVLGRKHGFKVVP